MIVVDQLEFRYAAGPFCLEVPELRVAPGEKAALIGPSGSGKTTLAFLIAGILVPQRGQVRVGEMVVSAAADQARRRFRAAHIGFVFQEFELLDYLTVHENILLPYLLHADLPDAAMARDRAAALAKSLGLGDKLQRHPRRLSQGERQRTAICRALVAAPRLVIADEPTGNLDPRTAEVILDLLLREVQSHQATLLMVTHNHALLDRFDRVLDLAAFTPGGRP